MRVCSKEGELPFLLEGGGMKIPGWIITIFISILMAAVLELNKNTLFGWFLFALAFGGMIITGRKYMRGWSWRKRGLNL